MNAVKLSGKHISAALELVFVLLVTAFVFRAGVTQARAQRGYDAYGGEYC